MSLIELLINQLINLVFLGASFAEALGMCTASTSFSRKKIPTSPIISIKSNKPEAGTSAQKTDKIKTESSSPKDEEVSLFYYYF